MSIIEQLRHISKVCYNCKYAIGGSLCGRCSECERNGSDGHCDCTRVVEEIANGRLEACPYKKTEI